jgi:nitrous oxidase accessory protein
MMADPSGPAIIHLRTRVYRGDLVVRRAVRLVGQPGTVLEGGGSGTVVALEADDAGLENVVVRRSGRRHTAEDGAVKAKGARIAVRDVRVEDSLFGISLGPCPDCVREGSEVIGAGSDQELRGDGIKLWEAHRSVVRGCRVLRSRDVVVWYSRGVLLEDLSVEEGRYGAHFMYAHDATVRTSVLRNNVVGIFVMYSARVTATGNVLAGARGAAGVGLGFKESDAVTLDGNWLVGNTTGLYLDRTPRSAADPARFTRNVIALNDVAVRLHSSQEGVTFEQNDFRENAVAAEVEGGGDALAVRFDGNYWSEYAGYDLDGDGTGDVAYEVKRLSGELTDSRPALRFFEGTGALGLIDAMSQAVPVLASRKLLVDAHPRVSARSVSP